MNVYPVVPPDADMVADPVAAPLQLAGVVEDTKAPTRGVGSVIVKFTVVEQLLLSRMATV